MQRKTASNRYTPEFKVHVVDWVMAEEGRNPARAGIHFSVTPGTIRVWMRQRGVEAQTVGTYSPETSDDGPPRPPSRSKPIGNPGGRYRAPMADLGQEDRERAVRTVRNIAEIVDLGSSTMLDRLKKAIQAEGQIGGKRHLDKDELKEQREEVSRLLRLSKDDAQAMLHLSRTQGLLIDQHPGVLKLAGVEEQVDTGKRNLARVARALGLEVPE